MSGVINNKSLINKLFLLPNLPDFLKPNLKEIQSKLDRLITYFKKTLTANIYLKALYNVRRIEYYKNPHKYPFTFFQFYQTLILSNWQFKHQGLDNLLYKMANKEEKLAMSLTDLRYYFKENDLNRQMSYLKLTRTLRNVYESKTNK